MLIEKNVLSCVYLSLWYVPTKSVEYKMKCGLIMNSKYVKVAVFYFCHRTKSY
jgi:hypothetical protein